MTQHPTPNRLNALQAMPDLNQLLSADIRKPLLLSSRRGVTLSSDSQDEQLNSLHNGSPPHPRELVLPFQSVSPAVLEQWTHLLVQAMSTFAPPAAALTGSSRVDSQGLSVSIVTPQ